MKCRIITSLVLFAISSGIHAQEILTFEKALEMTLANNYSILMAKVEEEKADNNASLKNNGYLPSVSASGAYNWTYFEGENRLITENRSFDANNSYNYNASAFVNYTLFDGNGRRYRYMQSRGNLKLTELQLQQVIQNTILELSSIYYEIARTEESVSSLEKAVYISKDRYERSKLAYDYGQSTQLDVLNAKVDLNADSIAWISGLQAFENLKRNLNFIMGQEIAQELSVDKEVDIRQNLAQEEVMLAVEENNLQLKLAESKLEINRYAIGNSKSSWLPRIGANAGYQYRGTEDPNGAFVIGSNIYGPQAGLSMTWNLFDGQNSVLLQNARLDLQNSQIEKTSLKQGVKSEALNAYATYKTQLFILRSQSDNLATAEDNFKRSEDAFKTGQISSLDFRQAQLNLLQAEQALSKAKYDAKNAEFQVLALMGLLVK